MPQLDFTTYAPQVVWLIITFIALFLVMWKKIVPAIAGSLEARQRRITGNLDKAADLKKAAATAIQGYENSLAQARADAQGHIAKTKARLAEDSTRREVELTEKMSVLAAESEARIAKALETAIADLRGVATEISAAAIERLSGSRTDDAQLKKTVDAAFKAQG